MQDLIDEVNYLVERFQEIDRQTNIIKNSKNFKKWSKKPLLPGEISETKKFTLTLWKNTSREEKVMHSISKILELKNKPIPQHRKKLIEIERIEENNKRN